LEAAEHKTREFRRRHWSQSAALRWPLLPRVGLTLTTRLPHEPTRRRLVMRGLRDTDAAFNRGDMEAAFIALAPDAEFQLPPAFPGAETLHGRRAVVDYYEQALREWTNVRIRHDSLEDVTPHAIAATFTLTFEGSVTGIGMEMQGALALEIERGQVVRVTGDVLGSRAL
jgi:ketosteroid isomerase-like protein